MVLAFGPLSRTALRTVHGSFLPVAYSALSLDDPQQANVGVVAGQPVVVRLTNHNNHIYIYEWQCTDDGVTLSRGGRILADGQTALIQVPTLGARPGRLQVSIVGTDVYVTATVLRGRS